MKDTNVPVESECCDGECNHDDCCGKVEANCTHKRPVPVETGLPCPHGRLPSGKVDGWKRCPHCLGLNNISPMKSVSVEKLKKEFFDRFEHKYGSFLTEEQVKLRAYIWSEIETSSAQAIQSARIEAKEEERKRIAEEVKNLQISDMQNEIPAQRVNDWNSAVNLFLSIINKHQ